MTLNKREALLGLELGTCPGDLAIWSDELPKRNFLRRKSNALADGTVAASIGGAL